MLSLWRWLRATPKDLNDLCFRIGVAVLFTMVFSICIKLIDGDNHRLGVIKFSKQGGVTYEIPK